MNPTKSDIVVVGNGMFGSAAIRHLAERGHQVVGIGAARVPSNDRANEGGAPSVLSHQVYSSHNDEARLTRRQDRNAVWADVTARAISKYRDLEHRSGISFFHDVGCLIVARPGGDGVSPDPLPVMDETDVAYTLYEPGDRSWSAKWPMLSLPDTHYVAHEPAPAGYLRPKRLIQAQNRLAAGAGAHLITDTVVSVERTATGFRVHTAANSQIQANRVLIASGAFSNFNGLLPEPLDLTIKSEVIVLGEIRTEDAARLESYPTVKFMIDPGELEGLYMVPPVRYGDGRFYIKMGANTSHDQTFRELGAVQRWFATATDPVYLSAFERQLRSLWPEVDFVSIRTEPCAITRTTANFPIIQPVGEGLFVAVGGNGGGAKGSDAWGEHAADLFGA